MNAGPVLIADDDNDDREIFKEAWKELKFHNPLIFFNNGEEVFEYMNSINPVPFLIICDVNLPRMDGFELKKKLRRNPVVNYKSIPFILWSTAMSEAQIEKAYDLGVNGFFLKEDTFEKIKQSLMDIVQYWKNCKTPAF